MSQRITLAITGASGSLYALRLLEQLLAAGQGVDLLISPPALVVLATETDLTLGGRPEQQQAGLCERYGVGAGQLRVYGREAWFSPLASGSNAGRAMVVCPCSMGTLSAIATGASNNLIERCADVMLKEQRQLLLLVRETPLSAIHLENMLKLARLGVTVMPAAPGFYHQPQSVADLVDFMVARILDHLGIEHRLLRRWGEPE